MESRSFGWQDVAAAAAGVCVGVLAARFLPPVIGQATGWAKTGLGADPFEHLIAEHRHITAVLAEMERSDGASRIKKGRLLADLKHTLARHAMAEEDALYPALLGAQTRDIVRHFYEEHGEVKIHLYELEQCVRYGVDWRDKVRVLRTMLLSHIREEEDVQFPKLREIMSGKSRRSLAGAIRREEAMVI